MAARLLAVVLLFPAAGLAQAPPSEVVPAPHLGDDALPQVANALKALRAGDPFPGGFEKLLREFQQRNPGAFSERELRRMLRENPRLAEQLGPDRLRELRDRFKGMPPAPGVPLEPPLADRRPGFDPFPQPARPDPAPDRRPAPDVVGPGELPREPDPPAPPPVRFPPGVEMPRNPFPQGGLPPGLDPGRPWPNAGGPIDGRIPRTPQVSPEEFRRRQEQLRAAVRFLEQNVGSMEKTPALRNLIAEMFTGSQALDPKTGEQLAKLLSGEGVQPGPNGELPDLSKALGDWAPPEFDLKLGDWKMPAFDFKLGDWSPPSAAGGGSGWSMGHWSGGGGHPPSFGAFGESWWPVVLFVIVLVAGLVLWRFWPELTGQAAAVPRALPGLGPWPVDPRTIRDRDALVRAFEYLSVLVCGAGARTWNHVTIAAALQAVGGGAPESAEPLARLYALARYAPADEPFPPEALAEARLHLCRLAGVPAP